MRQLRPKLKSVLRSLPGMQGIHFLYRFSKNLQSRNAALIQLRPPAGLFQPYVTTSFNRYPALFECARQSLRANNPQQPLRILSFGCSTGEEVFSLRRYFPAAQILGIDINRYNIARCNSQLRRSPDPQIQFLCAGSVANQPSGAFDLIFAMAVFRHGHLNQQQPPATCEPWLRFHDFEASVADLARCLKPSGLLVLQHSMFRLEDTQTASLMTPESCGAAKSEGPFYGPDHRLLIPSAPPAILFRKL